MGMPLTALVLGIGLLPIRGQDTGQDASQDTEEELAKRLELDVRYLSVTIGARHFRKPEALAETVEWIDGRVKALGYEPSHQVFEVKTRSFTNVELLLKGRGESGEVLVVGAHYDTCGMTPGADDNGSGVAVLLELARRFHDQKPDRGLRLVFFANEEPPFFGTEDMGSRHYAKRCKAQELKIIGMLALETMGYYSDEEGSQMYPPGLSDRFPGKGNFISFVSDLPSRDLLKRSHALFIETVDFPIQQAALPASLTGVDWSDHASFWKEGYPALMVTDTALFRNHNYHSMKDLPETLSYDRLARVTLGLEGVVAGLLRE